MTTDHTERCPGCGLVAPDSAVAPPPRFTTSSGCWALYGRLLARSYEHEGLRDAHQLVVDAYAVQHPASATRDQVQQVALCLMTLELVLGRGADPREGPALHQRMVRNLPTLHALDPPDTTTGTTVADVLDGPVDSHHDRVRAWASEVWAAWAPHHDTVRAWNDAALE